MENPKFFYESQKVKKLKLEAKKRFNKGIDWVMNNRDTLIVVVPLVTSAVYPIIKSVNKHITIRHSKDLKDLYCYDRSLGHYWSLKRELANNEWIEVDRRKQRGERLSDILESMRVLK